MIGRARETQQQRRGRKSTLPAVRKHLTSRRMPREQASDPVLHKPPIRCSLAERGLPSTPLLLRSQYFLRSLSRALWAGGRLLILVIG
jgi:hypothetical protein